MIGLVLVLMNVLNYAVTLEPDIANKSVKGSVLIRVLTASNVVELDCGDLTVDSVKESGKPLQFSVHDRKLRVSLGEKKGLREIEIQYHGTPYTQVLAAGGVEQEMSSFTALKESYGKQLLDNEKDLWLAAHEFAHQWWGNMVTCRDWNHFWLNEGIATFMAAAYLEHRFGRKVYMREIETYRANYEKVRAAGKDKSLVFPDWLNPTREDRTLVYDKGAYVMHLLREEMGERAFWKGLRAFTRRHFGKSVVTTDFVAAMEEAHGKSLKEFFAKWVYLQHR